MKQLSITKSIFGKMGQNQNVYIYTLTNKNGMELKITEFGGIITAIRIPRKNRMIDVVLGFNHLSDYLDDHPYFGAIIGRYANRISGGRFVLDGKEYRLATNNGNNHLHGGIRGFDKVLWSSSARENHDRVGVRFFYLSKDGEEGYPGNLKVWVEYRLNNQNELTIEYRAESDQKTPVNLTNHSYFNLNGEGNGDILNHRLAINADCFTPVDEELIPTGEIRSVSGTPLDFIKSHVIGGRIQLVKGGYDHNFILNKNDSSAEPAADLVGDQTGIRLEIFTSQPGIQFYSGNFLDGSLTGKSMRKYQKHFGLCLEPQHFPDSPNQSGFPQVILSPHQEYHQRCIYKFLF